MYKDPFGCKNKKVVQGTDTNTQRHTLVTAAASLIPLNPNPRISCVKDVIIRKAELMVDDLYYAEYSHRMMRPKLKKVG